MNFKNFVPYFFRNGFHHFLEVNNFVLVLIGGEKVNFIIINKRFSQNVHNCVGLPQPLWPEISKRKSSSKKLQRLLPCVGDFVS